MQDERRDSLLRDFSSLPHFHVPKHQGPIDAVNFWSALSIPTHANILVQIMHSILSRRSSSGLILSCVHNMGWSVPPCFRPFSFSGRDPVMTEEAHAFFLLLSEGLKKLERSLAEGSVSLRWSVEAMKLLKKMQIELVALFKRSQLPIAFAAEEDWFNQFMQETATLLDFCNLLKCALSGISRYRMVTDLAVQKIVEGGSLLSLNDLDFERLEKEYEMCFSIGAMKATVSLCSKSNCDESIVAVMLAAKSTMVAVSLILVSAIVSPTTPIDTAREELISRFPQLGPFSNMLTALVARFHERAAKSCNRSSRFVLAEREMVDTAVTDLRAQVAQGVVGREGFFRCVGRLRTSSAELREGVEMFDAVVDEVFDVVIRGRQEMLGILRDGVLSM